MKSVKYFPFAIYLEKYTKKEEEKTQKQNNIYISWNMENTKLENLKRKYTNFIKTRCRTKTIIRYRNSCVVWNAIGTMWKNLYDFQENFTNRKYVSNKDFSMIKQILLYHTSMEKNGKRVNWKWKKRKCDCAYFLLLCKRTIHDSHLQLPKWNVKERELPWRRRGVIECHYVHLLNNFVFFLRFCIPHL